MKTRSGNVHISVSVTILQHQAAVEVEVPFIHNRNYTVLDNIAASCNMNDTRLVYQSVLSHCIMGFFMLLVLIWVETVCKGYQQTTKVAASKKELGSAGATCSWPSRA